MDHSAGPSNSVFSSAGDNSRADFAIETRGQLLQMAGSQHYVGLRARIRLEEETFVESDPKIKEDVIRMIAQYLGDEGYLATKMMILDEANVKWHEREDQITHAKRIKKALLEGDWPEADKLCSKLNLRSQKAFLYAMYRQQYLEYIEHHDLQKAFTHLNKRLKPLEHLSTTAQEFRDLCYLLTAKSVHEAPSFRTWEGIGPSREKLVELFQNMIDVEENDRERTPFVPPKRLLTLLRQAVAYQIEFSRYHPGIVPRIRTLLEDYQSLVIPNAVRNTFTGHKGNVKCVEFVGERGQLLVSGSSDNTCRVWDTNSARTVAVLEGHSSRVWDVTSNRTGNFVASASADSTVKVWNLLVPKSEPSATLEGSSGDVYSVQWHPGSNHLVTGGYDKIVRLFDVERGVVLKTFTGHQLSVSKTIFSPLGNLIVSGSKDNTIKFWDLVSGICVRTIASHLGEVTSVEMSPNGSRLLSSSKDNSNRLWDLRTVQPVMRYKGHQNTSKNFIRSGFAGESLIVGGSEDGIMHIWDAEKGTLLSRLSGHGGAVYSASWNPVQSFFCSCSEDRTIKTWWFDTACARPQ
ncbi:WD40-repeat-containing domain protein [Zopfochytrium polystomum]|nr:WD40-repeat-containing domain protein [Zopfochytrium polystomum]